LSQPFLPFDYVQPGTRKGWWNALPNWWENQSTNTSTNNSNAVAITQAEAAVYDQLKAQDSQAKAKAAPDAWWLGTEYRGHNYALHTTGATAAARYMLLLLFLTLFACLPLHMCVIIS
jgi:hypothetical protein